MFPLPIISNTSIAPFTMRLIRPENILYRTDADWQPASIAVEGFDYDYDTVHPNYGSLVFKRSTYYTVQVRNSNYYAYSNAKFQMNIRLSSEGSNTAPKSGRLEPLYVSSDGSSSTVFIYKLSNYTWYRLNVIYGETPDSTHYWYINGSLVYSGTKYTIPYFWLNTGNNSKFLLYNEHVDGNPELESGYEWWPNSAVY